ncbi:cilia- and flagella-associated protein 52 [Neodiprion lecontei]|uniref:Cilia- and flagella-associated protein 52 n=1 Tax=Neodiprion lecontei TaxID=441921 RepID=A0A6J0BWH4_NEOLC|nr:cilia- and flagella-associated protein 52 [Neodiprion lecontei]
MDVENLELEGIIAFDGVSRKGLQLHPDNEHLIYAMGNKVTIKNIASGKQKFLTGHTNVISAVCVSPCGNYVGSGQINHVGFKAMVIVWNYKDLSIKGSHEIHKARVEDVCFTCESGFLISLGGRDDGNVVVWDISQGDAMCGSYASNEIAGDAWTITRMNLRDLCFITGGDRTLKVWRIYRETRKVYGVNVKVGKLRRSVNCIVVDPRDENAYCGTTSGDLIRARLNFYHNMEFMEPVKTPVMVGCYSKVPKNIKKTNTEAILYAGGITGLTLLGNERLVVGAGDGTVELVKILESEPVPNFGEAKLKLPTTAQILTLAKTNVKNTVTSMVLFKQEYLFVGTVFCEIYQIKLEDFDIRLLVTCHTNSIYDIAFPHNYSEVFATSSKDDVRVWRLETQSELLRITVPNFVCSSICFSYDGRMIISGWNDGLIRAFTPQTGRLIFTIHNSHVKAVSAVVITYDGTLLISGGCDGQVRFWDVKPEVQKLACVLKEHKGPVTSLHIASNDEEVISASSDGTCIIWDIVRRVRRTVLMGNTMYMAACFSPNAVQVLTCGTDRKIAYWETLDGSLVRDIEGSSVGALNCLNISPDGQSFITGSNDCIVKLWDYHTAETSHIGVGHAAIITACKFSPDSKRIVTVSADGAIMVWKCPIEPVFEKPPESYRSRSTCSIREDEWNKLSINGSNDGGENVMETSARSKDLESVKSVHSGLKESTSCTCDPAKPTRQTCEWKQGDVKVPVNEHGINAGSSSKLTRPSSSTTNKSGSRSGSNTHMAERSQSTDKNKMNGKLRSIPMKNRQPSVRTENRVNSNRHEKSSIISCYQSVKTSSPKEADGKKKNCDPSIDRQQKPQIRSNICAYNTCSGK